MDDRPMGTVTFLFTDIEGSTRLLRDLGAEHYRQVLNEHRRLLRRALTTHGGYEVDTQGDAFLVAFDRPRAGVEVCALHERVLEHVDAELRFTPDAVEAEDAVRNREAVAAFFLPPTDTARIRDVIDRGERLPASPRSSGPSRARASSSGRSTSTRPSDARSQSAASTGSSFLMPAATTSVRLRAPAPLR